MRHLQLSWYLRPRARGRESSSARSWRARRACAGSAQTPPRGGQSDRRSDPEVFVDSRGCPVFTRINFASSSSQASPSIPIHCCCSVKQKWVSARRLDSGRSEKRSADPPFRSFSRWPKSGPTGWRVSGKMAARDLQQTRLSRPAVDLIVIRARRRRQRRRCAILATTVPESRDDDNDVPELSSRGWRVARHRCELIFSPRRWLPRPFSRPFERDRVLDAARPYLIRASSCGRWWCASTFDRRLR